MSHNTPSANARDALSAARSAHYALRDAYADPASPPASGYAAGLHTEVKYGLKVAEVEALLAVAAEVAAVRAALLAGVPSTAEVTHRLEAPRHHPSCPVHHNAAGNCAGCLGPTADTADVLPFAGIGRAASTAELTRRIAAARPRVSPETL